MLSEVAQASIFLVYSLYSVKRIEKKLRKWMQYSFYIRLLVEEFLAVFISSLINVTLGIKETWGEIFSYALSIFMIVSRNLLIVSLDLDDPSAGSLVFLYT